MGYNFPFGYQAEWIEDPKDGVGDMLLNDMKYILGVDLELSIGFSF